MRRLTAAAALALAVTASVGVPAAAVADEPAPSSTTTAASGTTDAPATTSVPTTVTSTTTNVTIAAPSTTTVASPATRTPAVRALAAPASATVSVTSNGSDCAIGCFTPAQTTIAAGGTVTFTNASGVDHTVKRCTPAQCEGNDGGTGVDADFTSGAFDLTTDGTFDVTLAQPGTYVYYCSLHGYALMHGTITVTAAGPATTAPPIPPPVAPTVAVVDPNALASTGGAPLSLVGIAGALLVVGLAVIGLTARRSERR